MMSCRSLIQLFRDKNPKLLHKKDRVMIKFSDFMFWITVINSHRLAAISIVLQGKPTEAMKEIVVRGYGESNALDYIPGAEVLKTNDQLEDLEQPPGNYNHVVISNKKNMMK